MANTAEMPATAQKEKAASTKEANQKGGKKGSATKQPAEPKRRLMKKSTPTPPGESQDGTALTDTLSDSLDTQPQAVPAKATAKAKRGAAKAGKKPTFGDTAKLSPPFSLTHRFTPPEKSQCYLMATVAGEPRTFVTNVSVQMSHSFSKIMQQMLQEAKEGRFAIKADALKRRDFLVGEATSQAVPADESQAAPADSAAPETWHEDGQGQISENSGVD